MTSGPVAVRRMRYRRSATTTSAVIGRTENVRDGAGDVVGVRICGENHQEMNGSLAADGEFHSRQDGGHLEPLVASLDAKRLEERPEIAVSVDAVVVGEGDEVHSLPVCRATASVNEAFGDRRKPLGPGVLERLDCSPDVLAELLFSVERGMHMQVAPQPAGAGINERHGTTGTFRWSCAARHHEVPPV